MRTLRRFLVIFALTPAGAALAQPVAAPSPSVQEVTVVASTTAKQNRLDRTVYSVARDLQASTGTAADVLNTVPSVAVDVDGGLSLRGDPNVTVLVDGKPSAEFSGAARGLSLQQFSASQIDRIEVLTNPPAQFKAEGSGGVINIVTKKVRRAGLTGGAQLLVGDQRRYVANLDASYNVGALRLSGAANLRQDAKQRLTGDDRLTLDPVSRQWMASSQTIDERFRRLIPTVKASADYDLNPNQTLGAAFSHRELSGVRYFDQHNVRVAGAAPSAVSDRHSDGREWALDQSESLHFDQKLGRPGETLALSLSRSITREREPYAYTNSFLVPVAAPTFDHLRLALNLVKVEASADYDLPLAGDRELKLGYDFEDDRNSFDNVGDTVEAGTGRRIDNANVTNHFRYAQRINALYAQYETGLGRWRLQAGGRLEQADVSYLQITGGQTGGRRDFGVYPSLHLDRSVGDMGRLAISAARRVSRPDPEWLNPFADHQDTHNLRAGNPNLRPKDTWSFELGYNDAAGAINYGATAYLRLERDAVTDVLRPVSEDVVLSTRTNLPQSRSGGAELNASGKLGPKVSYQFSGNVFYTQLDASTLGLRGLQSTVGADLKVSVDAHLTAADTVQLSYNRTDRRLTPQGSLSAVGLVNLGYRRQLRPDLAVLFTVTDLLDGQRNQRTVASPTLNDVYTRHQVGRVALFGLVYTFGAPKKTKGGGFQYDQ